MAASATEPLYLADAGHLRSWDTSGTLTVPARVLSPSDGSVVVRTRPKTDFWQRTSYGFQRDDGHFCELGRLPADALSFEFTAALGGEFLSLYDQAGLMLRGGEAHWLKAGVEYVDEAPQFSCVVTRAGFSDWGMRPCGPGSSARRFWVRVRGAADGSVALYAATSDGSSFDSLPPREEWSLFRVAPFDWKAAR
jgi:uncharacterized protein